MAWHIQKRKNKSSTPTYRAGWERTFGGKKHADLKYKAEPQAGAQEVGRLSSGPTSFGEDPRNKLSRPRGRSDGRVEHDGDVQDI